MAVILITHDLTVVRQFSDYVYVMQHGEVSEHNATERAVRRTRSIPIPSTCSPPSRKGAANPLPENVADHPRGPRRARLLHAASRAASSSRDYYELVAVDSLEPQAAPPRDARPGRRIRLGQDHVRPGAAPAHRRPAAARSASTASRSTARSRDEMRPLRSRMQVVFQDPFSSLNPRMSIGQIIEEGLIVNSIGANTRERLDRVREALRQRRHARQHPVALPARILRRPAPAHRHRPRHRAGAGIHPARRADLGARSLGAGADHRPAAQAAGRDAA